MASDVPPEICVDRPDDLSRPKASPARNASPKWRPVSSRQERRTALLDALGRLVACSAAGCRDRGPSLRTPRPRPVASNGPGRLIPRRLQGEKRALGVATLPPPIEDDEGPNRTSGDAERRVARTPTVCSPIRDVATRWAERSTTWLGDGFQMVCPGLRAASERGSGIAFYHFPVSSVGKGWGRYGTTRVFSG